MMSIADEKQWMQESAAGRAVLEEKYKQAETARLVSEAIRHMVTEFKAKLDRIWPSLDTDGDGEVTKAELQAALRKDGTETDPSGQVKQLLAQIDPGAFSSASDPLEADYTTFRVFKELDINSDQHISKEEYYAAFFIEAKLPELFLLGDADHNGRLSRTEFQGLMGTYPELQQQIERNGLKLAHVLQQIEKNDGITKVEFLKLLSKDKIAISLFKRCSPDATGSVKASELAAGLDADEALMDELAADIDPKAFYEWLISQESDDVVSFDQFIEKYAALKLVPWDARKKS